MTKLTDMQLILLSSACQREDGSLLPPPESLGDQPDRVRKAVDALLKRGLVAEKEGIAEAKMWRSDGDITIGVVVTDAGRAIIDPPVAGESAAEVQAPFPSPARAGTKQAMVIDLLTRDGGASLSDITEATGWLPHTSRAALTGLRKKGHQISSEKVEGVTRYQIQVDA